jgi:hypothetical protein
MTIRRGQRELVSGQRNSNGQRNLVFEATKARLWAQYHARDAEREPNLAPDANYEARRRWRAKVRLHGSGSARIVAATGRSFE